MAERFLKFIPSEEAFWLIEHKPNAFRLLTYIANTARRTSGSPDGLGIGQCHLQHWRSYKLSEQEYRTAKKILVDRKHILILKTNRTRQKSTPGSTTNSTLVQIISSSIYDINPESYNDRINDRSTTDQRPINDKQERIRMIRMIRKDHPSVPSNGDRLTTDDFSFEKIDVGSGVFMSKEQLDACVKIRGDVERVKQAVAFIMKSPKRKTEITDWPNAIARWKIEDKAKVSIEKNIALAERLCNQFHNFSQGNGWQCRLYTDRQKDQKGILFECSNPHQAAVFISLVDGEFEKKCRETVGEKIAGKK